MTDELDHQVRMALRRRRRSRFFPIAVIVFAVCTTACAYLWVNYGAEIRTAVIASPQAPKPATASGEKSSSVGRADFDIFERQTTDSFRSAFENLEAQKGDLKTLSDQVTDLAAKVDALRNSAATAPTPSPNAGTVVPPRTAATAPTPPPIAQPVVPTPPASIAQRKKPQASKSVGRVSVGGAPLPIAPQSDR